MTGRNTMRAAALTDVCKTLLDDFDLTLGEIADLAKDISGECEDILQTRAECTYDNWYDPEGVASRQSACEETLVAAGRGHLIK